MQQTATAATVMDAALNAGVKFIHIPVDWPTIQPKQGVWNFTALDQLVAAAMQRKLNVILVLGPSPSWTVTYLGAVPSKNEVCRAKPALQAYREFATAVAQRYQKRVTYYQLWQQPTCTTLLAVPKDVFALYREGARAIHTVNPALKVIVVESGDVHLTWMRDYFASSLGQDRADIITLAPCRMVSAPKILTWRLLVLRNRVMPRTKPPELWMKIDFMQADKVAATLATAVLQNISHITLEPATIEDSTTTTQEMMKVFTQFRTLIGATMSGWRIVSPDIYAGKFSKGTQQTLLIAPLRDGELQLSPDGEGGKTIAVSGGTLTYTIAGGICQTKEVTDKVTIPVTALQPVLLSGAQMEVQAGLPEMRPEKINSESVSLDQTGTDPLSIQPLRLLPGGKYSQYTVRNGFPVLATIREVQPWVHFDIPDGFLFFNIERVPVEISVKVYGVSAPKKTGLNIYYDGIGGMRSTNWQWIDVGFDETFTYTFRIPDSIFADNEGYDFRVNMGGSIENVRVVDVTVRKVSSAP